MLLVENQATVGLAERRCKRPSAPLLGSTCLRKSSLSWGGRNAQLRIISHKHTNVSSVERCFAMDSLFQDGHDRFQNSIKYVYEDGVSCKDMRGIREIKKFDSTLQLERELKPPARSRLVRTQDTEFALAQPQAYVLLLCWRALRLLQTPQKSCYSLCTSFCSGKLLPLRRSDCTNQHNYIYSDSMSTQNRYKFTFKIMYHKSITLAVIAFLLSSLKYCFGVQEYGIKFYNKMNCNK